MVSFDDFPVTLADYTPGLSDLRTSIDGHPTGFYGNEWSGITGVLVTYENVLYVSAVSVTPQQ